MNFFGDGTFHRKYHWHYWVIGARAVHVQWTDPNYKPETAAVFTFNDDLTVYACPQADGSPGVVGIRLELATP